MNWAQHLCVLGVVGVTLSGCGGSVSGAEGSGGATSVAEPVEYADYAAALAAAVCEPAADCCQKLNKKFDSSHCSANGWNVFAGDQASLDAGYARWDATAARHCIDVIAAMGAMCERRDLFVDLAVQSACEPVLVGLQPVGSQCLVNEDCAGEGVVCEAGRCQAKPFGGSIHAKSGEACDNTCEDFKCQYEATDGSVAPVVHDCYRSDGLACGPTKVCQAPGALGAVCVALSCGEGLFCDSGHCAAKHDTASCAADPDACSSGMSCNSSNQKCEATPSALDLCQ